MFAKNKHLFIGIIFALPFFILNALVVSGAPVLKMIRPYIETTGFEQILILVLLALVFIGGVISLYPVIKDRRFMVANILVAVLFVGFSIMAGYGLGKDVYHCDILQIPNCD
jgi:hypothetical protein